MAKGKVDIRSNGVTGKSRLRFYDVHPDTREVVLQALAQGRLERGTEHDTIALEAICLAYLNTPAPMRALP